MDAMEAETLLKKLDRRLQNVEQILPTLPTREEMYGQMATKDDLAAAVAPLATKAELADAVAPLATKAELAAAIAPLATKADLREESEGVRRHFDVVAESLRDDLRLIAENQVATIAELRQGRKELNGTLKNHEKRITRLEASETRRRARKSR